MRMHKISLGHRSIESHGEPFVIAEAGSNFDQSLDRAVELIDIAADAGADAVKFQLFNADSLYPPGSEMHSIFKRIELSKEWLPSLAEHAARHDLIFLSSVFDIDSFRFLEQTGVVAHKVASSEVTNLTLLSAIAQTGKPIFLATGMSDLSDIELALQIISSEGDSPVVLMQCGSVYPLPLEDANLRVLRTLETSFSCITGFSDHTLGKEAAVAGVALGGVVFEKHFTYDRNADGPDHHYALNPGELADYILTIKSIHKGLGDGVKRLLPQEIKHGRRDGIYARKDMKVDQQITIDDVIVERPALGIRARHLQSILGRTKTKRPIKKGAPVNWADIKL